MISPFNKIELSEEDVLRGMILSTLQKQVLTNRLAELGKELIDLPILEVDKQKYFDQLAYFKGQYAEVHSMLVASDEAEQKLLELTKE